MKKLLIPFGALLAIVLATLTGVSSADSAPAQRVCEVTFTVREVGPLPNNASYVYVDFPNGVTWGRGWNPVTGIPGHRTRDEAYAGLVALPAVQADLADSLKNHCD